MHLLLVKFKASGEKRAYTFERFEEDSIDVFFFEGGVEIDPIRFGNEKAGLTWLATNNIRLVK